MYRLFLVVLTSIKKIIQHSRSLKQHLEIFRINKDIVLYYYYLWYLHNQVLNAIVNSFFMFYRSIEIKSYSAVFSKLFPTEFLIPTFKLRKFANLVRYCPKLKV